MIKILLIFIGTIKYLTGGDKDLRLKQKTIRFTDQVNNPDANNDDMVTKYELEEFLNKNLKPNKNKGNRKIIKTILDNMFDGSKSSIDTKDLFQKLEKGIDFKKPYGNNTIFIKNTKSKLLI